MCNLQAKLGEGEVSGENLGSQRWKFISTFPRASFALSLVLIWYSQTEVWQDGLSFVSDGAEENRSEVAEA